MLNKVELMGRITHDIELKQTQSGTMVTQFTIAVEQSFKPQNGERQSDFIPCVAWRNTAEFISKYFAKGRMICVVGNLRTRTYDDKRYPDVKHYVMEVYVDEALFTGEKKPESNGNSNGGYYQQPAPTANTQKNTAQQPATTVNMGDLGDFEEVIGDSVLPF